MPQIDERQVDLLIGAGTQIAHQIYDSKNGLPDQLRAVRTGLGWTLVGPDPNMREAKTHTVNNVICNDDLLHTQMQQMFDHDFIEDRKYSSDDLAYSIEDKRALTLLDNSVTKVNGRIQVCLPWRDDNVKLPYNRHIAENRLQSLKRRFERDDDYFQKYKAKIDESLIMRLCCLMIIVMILTTFFICHHAVGAERELSTGIRRWNKQQINDCMCQQGIEWRWNPPASSHQGGVFERMIRSVRKIVRVLTKERVLSDESLHSLMVEIEWILNNRPLTTVNEDPNDSATLSPMSLLTGRLDSSLPPDVFVKSDGYKRSWRAVQLMSDQFWSRWIKEYLPLLQQRQKWMQPVPNFKPGDVVLMVNENTSRGVWPKALVVKSFPDADGVVRRVQLKTATSTFMRDIRKLCLLEAVEA